MTGRASRLRRLEDQRGPALSLWAALPEDRRAQVTPETLERAAQDTPDSLRGDVPALALWAFLSVPS